MRAGVLLSRYFKEMIQNPCLWLGIINVITACLEALSFLGRDPGLADSSSQCGGW